MVRNGFYQEKMIPTNSTPISTKGTRSRSLPDSLKQFVCMSNTRWGKAQDSAKVINPPFFRVLQSTCEFIV